MGNVDILITESQRLRNELLRTAARLDAFCEQLTDAVSSMGGDENGDGPGDTATGHPGESTSGEG